MPGRGCNLLIVTSLVLAAGRAPGRQRPAAPPGEAGWRAAMARVHARFTGRPGTFAHLGEPITVSLVSWLPLRDTRENASPEMERGFRLIEERMQPECWRHWKGPDFGNDGGRATRWADENGDAWLERLDPEAALIMFGTKDMTSLQLGECRDRLRAVARRCLENGTVVILGTISARPGPARPGLEREAEAFAGAVREVARELAVPLVAYPAEILKRPHDWDEAAKALREFEGYDVPTLIARDGVHTSAPDRFRDDYPEEALRCHGYTSETISS
jgi:hypothetical protein